MTYNKILLIAYIVYLCFMSFIAFILYFKDKRLAIKNKERIKEKTLLLMASIGGAVGSLIGRIVFHHKTEKSYFSFVIYISIILELAVLGIMIYTL